MLKSQISERMVSSVISDVAFILLYTEKNAFEEVLDYVNYYQKNNLLVNEKRRCRDG